MSKTDPKAQSDDSPRSNIGQLSQIFERLVDSPRELRDGLLEELCPDPDLRRQVQTMLAADSEADPLLDHSLVPQPVTVDLGESIDGYKLLRELGDGGMGLVYEAEQLEPVRRNVALKIMKPGLDTRDVIERFNAERQALSMMSHPNIAKVFDAGATELGRPYFVMELVRGRPITSYCEEKSLDLTARLQLFLTVCHAIQHAHQKGVIHRDIKPSNVLVGDVDGRSVAKVIDFGVAKAIHGPGNDATEFTRAGQIVGTLEYMSPEQSRPHATDVDTRSDIYSLGVLLYELLANRPPFDRARLRTAGWEEVLNIIRTEDPPRPSIQVAEKKGRDAARQARMLRGELDWIILKAMEKDRSRRYATPNELAQDIERFLQGEAVVARPPSTFYALSKLAKRNRTVFVSVTLVSASLILGMITTTFYAMRLSHAKTEVSEMNEFLKDRLFGLAASESAVGFSADPNLRMLILLKDASEELDKRFPQQSELKSDLQRALARSFRRIGEHQESTKLFADYLEYLRSKHGLRHPDSIWVMAQMVQNYIEAGELDLAQEDCDVALRYCNALGERHELTTQLRSLQGTIASKRGNFEEAKEILEESLIAQQRALGARHATTLSTQSELAVTLESLQDFATAERLHRETLSAHVNVSGTAKRSDVAEAQALLGKCLLNRSSSQSKHSVPASGEPIDEAVRLLEMSREYFQEVRGRYDPRTLDLQLHLASGFCEQHRLQEAESLLLDLRQRMVGLPRMEANMVQAANLLGWSYLEQEEFAKAEAILDEAWELVQRREPNSPQAIQVMSNLAIARNLMGKLESALELDQQVFRSAAEVFGGANPAAVAARVRLALGCFELGRHRKGQTLLEGCLADEQTRRAIAQQDAAGEDLTETLALALTQSYQLTGELEKARAWASFVDRKSGQ